MNETLNDHGRLLELTSEIVAAHVANNHVSAAELPEAIGAVYRQLAVLGMPKQEAKPVPKPAVPIKKSITDDYIVCLEDGRKLKMLKRHLRAAYDMSPEAYRAKWGLAPDYPMVAPNYTKVRRRLAKKIGLGRKPAPDAGAKAR